MYEIKVLSRGEFDRVAKSDPRYKYVDETNFGFADRLKGHAYVLDTRIHDLNKYLINHELEELEEDESTHEDPNGIRHKKGPKIFKDIILPGMTAGLFGGGGNFIQKLFGGGESQSQPQEQQASSGSYNPLQNLMNISGGFPSGYSPSNMSGGYGSPLNLFPTSGSYSPANVPDSISGANITNGLGSQSQELPPDILERLKGSYAGRLVF